MVASFRMAATIAVFPADAIETQIAACGNRKIRKSRAKKARSR
jgi:hypothetical protein